MSSSCAYVHMYTFSVTPIKCYGLKKKKKSVKTVKKSVGFVCKKKMPQFSRACLQMSTNLPEITEKRCKGAYI